MAELHIGRVIQIVTDRKFGFVKESYPDSNFKIHFSLLECNNSTTIKENEYVIYRKGIGKEGKPTALDVVPIFKNFSTFCKIVDNRKALFHRMLAIKPKEFIENSSKLVNDGLLDGSEKCCIAKICLNFMSQGSSKYSVDILKNLFLMMKDDKAFSVLGSRIMDRHNEKPHFFEYVDIYRKYPSLVSRNLIKYLNEDFRPDSVEQLKIVIEVFSRHINKKDSYIVKSIDYLYRNKSGDFINNYEEYVKLENQYSLIGLKLEIRKILLERKVENLYHFTNINNLLNILNKGLLPRDTLDNLNISYTYNDSLRQDKATNANCLSISYPNYKMLYASKMDGNELVILEFYSSLIYDYDCAFCKTNAASNAMVNIPLEERKKSTALEEMFYDAPSRKYIAQCYTTDPQAELLVLEPIAMGTYLKKIYFEDAAHRDNFANALNRDLRNALHGYMVSDNKYFKPRADYFMQK